MKKSVKILKSDCVHVRTNPAIKQALSRIAKEQGMTVSEFVSGLMENAVRSNGIVITEQVQILK